MSLSLIIYLANVVNTIIVLSWVVFVCAFVTKLSFKIRSLICLFSGLVILFAPTKDTIYLMAGAKGLEQITQTTEATKARTVLNLGLDQIINNLQEK